MPGQLRACFELAQRVHAETERRRGVLGEKRARRAWLSGCFPLEIDEKARVEMNHSLGAFAKSPRRRATTVSTDLSAPALILTEAARRKRSAAVAVAAKRCLMTWEKD